MNFKYRFENNYLLGCIRYKQTDATYLMPLAWWILNYKKYDPKYDPAAWKDVYRDNILNVSKENVSHFIKSIEPDKISISDISSVFLEINAEYRRICFFIDFDNNLYINGYFENIELQDYLPDESWHGKMDDPKNYLSKRLIDIFYRLQ